MVKPSIKRFELPKPKGLGGLFYRARWSLSSARRRREEFSRMVWLPRLWENDFTCVQTLVKMRHLLDKGLHDGIISADPQARRLQRRAHEAYLSSLGYDAIHVIKENLPVGALHLLLEAGVGVDHRENNHHHDTLITSALRHGQLGHARFLITHGASLDVVDSCGHSPLRMVIDQGGRANSEKDRARAFEMLDELLKAGAKPNFTEHLFPYPDEDRDLPPTALVEAACHGWTEAMQKLIDAGARADIRIEGKATGRSDMLEVANNFAPTRLRQAADTYERFNRVLDLMVQVGADIDMPNADGNTALAQAVRTGEMGLALALLDRGANTRRIPGEPTFAHLVCIGANFEDPNAHAFIQRMPEGFWQEKDDQGKTAFDILYHMQSEGRLAPYVEGWMAMASAEHLNGASAPAQPLSRPRARL